MFQFVFHFNIHVKLSKILAEQSIALFLEVAFALLVLSNECSCLENSRLKICFFSLRNKI